MSVLDKLEPWEGDLDAQLPLPSDLRRGTLPNGLQYFVRPSQKPKARASLALAVKVGSVLEEDAEHGLSHILEHLAFSATESFQRHDVVKFLESIGASFGACTNAYTSYDETVFELFGEEGGAIRCAPEDLQLERGAVLDEYRLRTKGAGGRNEIAYWKLAMEGSAYGNRTVIGTEESIKGISAEMVRSYYEKWYHPGLMALCISGDFPDGGKEAERLIKSILGAVTTPALARQGSKAKPPPPPQLPPPRLPLHTTPRIACYVDREASTSNLTLTWKRAKQGERTAGDYRRQVLEQIFAECFNTRLYKVSRARAPPFYTVGCEAGDLGCCETFSVACTVECAPGAAAKALEAILTEVARVRVHGFLDSEIQRAVSASLADTESYLVEGGQKYAADIRSELVRHFLTGELVLDPPLEARVAKTFLTGATGADILSLAEHLRPERSMVVKVTEHRPTTAVPELQQAIARAAGMERRGGVGPWTLDDGTPERLVAEGELPPPGSLAAPPRFWPALGCSEMQLSNGMRVVSKRTANMEDEILFRLFAPGGISELPQAVFHEAMLAKLLAEEIGIYGLKPEVLDDLLAGRRIELSVSVGSFWRAIEGDASRQDLETALQLLFKLFTTTVRPSAPSDLDACIAYIKENLQAREREPMTKFSRRVRELNFGDSFYFRSIMTTDIDSTDADLALSVFNRAFCDPSEWTLVMVGSLPEDDASLHALLAKYLACIPVPGARKRGRGEADAPAAPSRATARGHGATPGPSRSPSRARRPAPRSQEGPPSPTPAKRLRATGGRAQGHGKGAAAADVVIPSADAALDLSTGAGERHTMAENNVEGPPPKWAVLESPLVPSDAIAARRSARGLLERVAGWWRKSDAATAAKYASVIDFRVPSILAIRAIPWSFPALPVSERVHVRVVDGGHSQTIVTIPAQLTCPEGGTVVEDYFRLVLLERVLETRLVQRLRFRFGETYTVSASLYFGATAPSERTLIRGDVQFSFSCTPELAAQMTDMALDEAESLQREGPSREELCTVVEILERAREVEVHENAYWLSFIADSLKSRKYVETGDVDAHFRGVEAAREKIFKEALAAPATLCRAAQTLLPAPCRARYTAISSVPEESALRRLVSLRPLRASELLAGGVAWGALGLGVSTAAVKLIERFGGMPA